ncbi:MAG: hypothetical protein JRJ62_01500 [Deltaproteobacteria bacterium]|nr:hypothetical protein [Deltaproteobacteria bacterium]
MSDSLIVSLDAGTTGARCFIFNIKGDLIQSSRAEWTFTATPKVNLGLEFQPEQFWQVLCSQIKNCFRAGNINPENVKAIACTSMREAQVILGEKDEYLLATPAHDLRALSQAMKIFNKHRDTIYQVTGRLPPMIFALARLLWMKRKMKEEYARISMLLLFSDWMNFMLCGEKASEPSVAGESMLFDVRKRTWSEEILNLFEITPDILPQLKNAGEIVGEINEKAAKDTGLKKGTPVVMAGADSQCGLLGMGLNDDLNLGIIAGSTAPLQVVTDKPLFDSELRTWTNCHLLQDKWILEANTGRTGAALLWFKKYLADFGLKEQEPFEKLEELIKDVPPGARGVWAFLGPMITNAGSLEGLGQGGFLFPLPIAEDNSGLPLFYKAALENAAYAFRGNYEILSGILGSEFSSIGIGGGMVQSSTFVQIVADVLQKPVHTYQTFEATALGASICATVGVNIYGSFNEATDSMIHPTKTFSPSPQQSKYKSLFKRWLQIMQSLKSI